MTQTIRERAVSEAARALFLFDAGWAGIPGQETDQRFEQERRVYTARATAAFDAVIYVLMDFDDDMRIAGDEAVSNALQGEAAIDAWEAMLRRAAGRGESDAV
jgi:hypothetical protein